MSETFATPTVPTATQITSSTALQLDRNYVKMYTQGSLERMPFNPVYTAGSKAGGTASFGDYVRAQHEYANTNLDTSTRNARYFIVKPLSYGANEVRPLHVVTHNTPHLEHEVVYNIVPVDTAVDVDLFKTMTTAWRGLFANIGTYTKVTLDELYAPLLERAFGCYWSLLFSPPASNLTMDPLEWSDPATWTGSGGILRTGPTNQDPTVNVALGTRIPIYLPTNLRTAGVDLGLTLLAVGARAHFYPIANNGNPFSNYFYNSPNPVTFLSSQPIPNVRLTAANAFRALQQLAQVCDYLGVTDAAFQMAASRSLRALWVVPDTFTLNGVFEDSMLRNGAVSMQLLGTPRALRERLELIVPPSHQQSIDWLIAQCVLLEADTTRAIDVFNSMDQHCVIILNHLSNHVDPYAATRLAHAAARAAYNIAELAEPGSGGPVPVLIARSAENIIAWDSGVPRPILREEYIRPITYVGYTTERPVFDWSTHLYLSLNQRLSVDSFKAVESPISRAWLPMYNFKFLGATAFSMATLQTAAINIAPVTLNQTRGPAANTVSNALLALDVDHYLYQKSTATMTMFASTCSAFQLAHTTFTVMPPGSTSRAHPLPANWPRRFSEIVVTFTDPLATLAVHGIWTPQCPVVAAGISKMYPILRKPTLQYDSFIIDGPVDMHTMLIRAGLTLRMIPQLTCIDLIDAEGYAAPVQNIAIYERAYLNEMMASSELVWRMVPSMRFDRFTHDEAIIQVATNSILKGAAQYPVLPEIQFRGTPIMEVKPSDKVEAITEYGKRILKGLLSTLTLVVPANQALSAAQSEATAKLGMAKKLIGTDNPSQFEENAATASIIGSVKPISPSAAVGVVKAMRDVMPDFQ